MSRQPLGDYLVRVQGATFGYDAEPVLQDVTLTIEPDDFIGVVGPSGSGKTSLLRLLLGTATPQHGTVTRRPGAAVAYVPQLETVNWNFPVTVAECVLMARTGRTLPWPTRRRQHRDRLVDRKEGPWSIRQCPIPGACTGDPASPCSPV